MMARMVAMGTRRTEARPIVSERGRMRTAVLRVPVNLVMGVVLMMMVTRARRQMFGDAESGGSEPRLEHAIGGDLPAIDRKAAERALEIVQWQPCVQQGADDHVACGTGKTVEVQHPHSRASSEKLKYRPSPRMMWSST